MEAAQADSADAVRDWLKKLASPSVVFYSLPWLMLLLILGTTAQKEIGVFEAQRLYFSAWIIWLGPLPLPGSYPTLGLITISLFAKFLLYSPWRRHQAGIIITHLGVLILLLGGLVTAFTQQEGFISLKEGQRGSSVSGYYNRVLTIEKNEETVAAYDVAQMKEGIVTDPRLPFSIAIESVCANCRPVAVKDTKNRHGLAAQVTLTAAPEEKENELNLSGVNFTLSGLTDDQNGHYLVMEEIPVMPEVTVGEDIYRFSIGRRQTALPFSIELVDFKRELHPGTDMARAFSSDVIVHDGGVNWPYHIRMNEPLRYKGYTFYQSSFSLRPDGEYSVLSVVQNKGRIFPYIASAVMFAGLLFHVLIKLAAARKTE